MSYQTETYPTSIDVRVTWRDDAIGVDSIEDSIKGETVDHAMARASENWPGAEIVFLAITEREPLGAEA